MTPEQITISRIADRAVDLYKRVSGIKIARVDVVISVSVVHEDLGLDLAGLLAADDNNFAHDIGGIMRHLNHKTLRLDDYWLPRFHHAYLAQHSGVSV